MLVQSDSIQIERLIFVCKNLSQHFENEEWKNFYLSPIRKTRSYMLSRYLIFKNIMLEFLELLDPSYATNFAFNEEWKISETPIWVGIGLKVQNLENSLTRYLKQYQIAATEVFISQKACYSKGFAHKSALINFKIQNRAVYLTEYDEKFEWARNSELYESEAKRAALPSIKIPAVNMALKKYQNLIYIDNLNRAHLNIIEDTYLNCCFQGDWIVFN